MVDDDEELPELREREDEDEATGAGTAAVRIGVEAAEDAADEVAETELDEAVWVWGAGGSKIRLTTALTTAIVTFVWWCACRRNRCESRPEPFARLSYADRIHALVVWSEAGWYFSWNVRSSYWADVRTRYGRSVCS